LTLFITSPSLPGVFEEILNASGFLKESITGRVVTATVTKATKSVVELDVGLKFPAVVKREETG
jgi:ribosomal protein S1